MKIKFLIPVLISFFFLNNNLIAQKNSIKDGNAAKQLIKLNNRLATGWNTWYTNSVLSHVLLPAGFAIDLRLLNHQQSDTLKEALIGREDYGTKEHVVPGPHAYDGSYTDLTAEWKNIIIRVQSATKKNAFFLLISPVKHSRSDSLIVYPKMLWGKKGQITVMPDRITVHTPSGEIKIKVAGGKYSISDSVMTFSLDHVIALCSDQSRSAEDVERIINDSKKKFTAVKSGYKELSEEYNAMQTVLAWNTIYDPINKRAITPVSRNWAAPDGGWVLFDWDTYFAAYMLSLDNKDLAYANAIAITKEITKKGFIPNNSQPGHKSEDRTEPPVGAIAVLAIYKRFPEKWFLREVFDELLSWNRWRSANRDIDGYLVYGTDPYDYGTNKSRSATESGKMKAAKWESGMDNSPMWDDAVFDTANHRMMLADVGLMSLYIADCQSLSKIARVLGKTAIEQELNERAERYSRKLKTLWNDTFGLYLNKDLVTGKFSYRLSPTLFYPLLSKVPSQKQAERMIKEHFYSAKEFWGQYIMPSIARNDPAYKDNHYWRGRIWAPLNFLVYLGIRNYDLPGARKDMVVKSKNLLLKSWAGENHVYENYSAETGRGDDDARKWSDAFYHWGALLGFINLIEKGYVFPP
ncbi:MGH1-like glycoside hydrolase domain-containing protein [Ginsengibacter hankyongi]|nr:trehalase family glycosidase [Ginsengibacter hankyongi]